MLYTDGRGNWTSKGCSNQTDGSGGNVTCSCNHLTNFAVLMVSSAAALSTQIFTLLENILSVIFVLFRIFVRGL